MDLKNKMDNVFFNPLLKVPEHYIFEEGAPHSKCAKISDIRSDMKLKKNFTSEEIIILFPKEIRDRIQVKKSGSIRLTNIIDTRRTTNGTIPSLPSNISETLDGSQSSSQDSQETYRPSPTKSDEDSDGEDNKIRKTFLFNHHEVHLTYKTHIDLYSLKAFMINLMESNNSGIMKYSIVNEKSDKTNNYDHTHAYFMFKQKTKIKGSNAFDYEGIHPHIKLPRGVPAFVSSRIVKGSGADIACRYHLKQETAKRISNYPICSQEEKEEDVVKGYSPTPSDLAQWSDPADSQFINWQMVRPDIKAAPKLLKLSEIQKSARPVKNSFKIANPYDWQIEVPNIVESDTSGRTVTWVADQQGGNGKSILCKEMASENGAILITSIGKVGDLKHTLRKELEKNPKPSCIIFDLARSVTTCKEGEMVNIKVSIEGHDDDTVSVPPLYDNKEFFVFMEELKGGSFLSTKYDSANVDIGFSVNIIVMSNYFPNVTALSLDRWIICSMSYDTTIDAYVCGEAGSEVLNQYDKSIKMIGKKNIIGKRSLPLSKTTYNQQLQSLTYKVKDFYFSKHLIPMLDKQNTETERVEYLPGDETSMFKTKVLKMALSTRPMTAIEVDNYERRRTLIGDPSLKTEITTVKLFGETIHSLEKLYTFYKSQRVLPPVDDMEHVAKHYITRRLEGLDPNEIAHSAKDIERDFPSI